MPLVISAPWLPQSVGLRSSSIVELVDIFPTTVALAGLKPPPGETLDGTSLAPLLSKPLPPGQSWDKVALSQYPRCPASADGETWTTNATLMWINKWVRPSDLTTRSSDAPLLPTAGASSRTASTSRGWASPCALPSSGAPPPPQHDSSTLCLALTLPIVRVCRSYTEWAQWDGATQHPNWSVLPGRELYDHSHADNNDFDATENTNLAEDTSHASTVAQLSAQLHALVKSQEPPPVAQ